MKFRLMFCKYFNMKKIYLGLKIAFTVLFLSCSSGDDDDNTGNNNESSSATIWKGTTTTFTKLDGADPSKAENQDRITANVWITRGNSGGQIYNAANESNSDKNTSPTGTKWALGTIDKVSSLSFKNFRSAVGSPKDVVGKDLVMHLETDNIFLSVKFTSWSSGKGGGFAYQRSTK